MLRRHPLLTSTVENIGARWRVVTTEIVRLRHDDDPQVGQTDLNNLLAAIAQVTRPVAANGQAENAPNQGGNQPNGQNNQRPPNQAAELDALFENNGMNN